MNGGPLRRLQRRVGLPPGPVGFLCLGLAIAALTWIPLLVLTLAANTLVTGATIPFAQSLSTHVRLLVTLPLFFLAEVTFDRRIQQVLHSMVASHLVPGKQVPLLGALIRRVSWWLDSWILEAALVVLSLFLTWETVRPDFLEGTSSWRIASDGHVSLADWWYSRLSLPVFHFLSLRLIVRLLIWVRLLLRMVRLDLQLLPTHPDLSGGLGGLGAAHMALAPLGFGLSSIIAATQAEQIRFAGADIRGAVMPLAVAILGGTLLLVVPLVLFIPKLLETKQKGLFEYGQLGGIYTRAFDLKWLRSATPPTEQLLGSADVQSLADLANAYGVIRQMRFVPIAPSQALYILVVAALPALPLILFVVPLDELIIRSVRTLLSV